MKAEERRNQIIKQLSSGAGAVSGSTLAARFGVSRQIIVQDITILRGAGYDILSTHNGYIIQKNETAQEYTYEGIHDKNATVLQDILDKKNSKRYINPNASFSSTVVYDENREISALIFVQK